MGHHRPIDPQDLYIRLLSRFGLFLALVVVVVLTLLVEPDLPLRWLAPAASAAPPEPQSLTPRHLYEATYDGDLEAVRRLLDTGISPDATVGNRRDCPLWVAAFHGHAEVAAHLLERGATPGCGHESALLAAARDGHLAVVEVFLAALRPKKDELVAALHAAAANGHPRTATALVDAGASVNSADAHGLTPLHLAARDGRPATVRALLAAGADLHATDPAGRTALHWASWRRQPSVVRVLLRAGADPEIRDAGGDRPFLDAGSVEEAMERMAAIDRRLDTSASCAVLPLPGTGGVAPEAPESVTAWGAPREPPAGTAAWGLAGEGLPAQRLRLEASAPDTCAGRWYDSVFVSEGKTLREPEDDPVHDWLVILQMDEGMEGGVEGGVEGRGLPRPTEITGGVPREHLPWGIFPATVDQAADLDGDGRADAFVRSFCCGAGWISVADLGENGYWPCDYTCWDSWWRGPEGWMRCAKGGPC